MEPNLRDTPLRRFNTFWWGLALFFVFALAAYALRQFSKEEPSPVEVARGKERVERRALNLKEQMASLNAYKDLGDGKAQVPPSEVFGLAQEIGLLDAPKASEVKHNKQF